MIVFGKFCEKLLVFNTSRKMKISYTFISEDENFPREICKICKFYKFSHWENFSLGEISATHFIII